LELIHLIFKSIFKPFLRLYLDKEKKKYKMANEKDEQLPPLPVLEVLRPVSIILPFLNLFLNNLWNFYLSAKKIFY